MNSLIIKVVVWTERSWEGLERRYRDWDFISSFQETLLKKQCLIQEDSDRVWGMDLYVGSLISNPRSKNETRSEWNKGGGKINIRCFLRLSSWANEILIINGQFVKPESSIWRIEGGNAYPPDLISSVQGLSVEELLNTSELCMCQSPANRAWLCSY